MLRAAPATEPLGAQHRLEAFDCGEPSLNTWLHKFALTNQRNGSSRTRVIADQQGIVFGYYSLAAGSINHDEVPPRISRGLARHSVPIVVLTRLAVGRTAQRQGLGRTLLRDALRIVAEVSDSVGVRALFIHAKHDQARDWYLHQVEFDALPGVPHKLFLLMKDLRRAIGKDQ